jgi:soluble lytic murein transglycosylase-like protein
MVRRTLLTTLAAATMLFSGVTQADCFTDAAAYQRVNPTILKGIATVESQMDPKAINRNKNGSIDFGIMQVNSIHLPELKKYKIGRRDLMQSCKNIYVAAWLLRRSMNRYGNTWAAVGGYHSNTPKERAVYAIKVRQAVKTILAAKQQTVRVASLPPPHIPMLLASN